MIFDYTDATLEALDGLRDWSTMQWYVIPLLAIVFYIYTIELKKARKTGNWIPIICGLTVFGMDFLNETWNGWVCVLSGRSAFWTTPGPTALRVMVGWNIEIIFMFLLNGIVFANMLEEGRFRKIVENANDLIQSVDAKGRFLYVIRIIKDIGILLLHKGLLKM